MTPQTEQRLAKRKLIKNYLIPYLLFLTFREKAHSLNMTPAEVVLELIKLFVAGKVRL